MDRIKRFLKSEEGFSLTEILMVLAIIGILILLALPNFKPLVNKVKAMEAKDQLRYIKMLQNTYYLEHDRYAKELSEIGFSQIVLVTEGGEARYRIDIVNADELKYEIQAVAVVDFDKDGVYNTWKVDETGKITEVIPD